MPNKFIQMVMPYDEALSVAGNVMPRTNAIGAEGTDDLGLREIVAGIISSQLAEHTASMVARRSHAGL
jgi:hypothetical protein